MPSILEGELRRKARGVVGISTVTDPYQPAERKYGIARKCLEVLLGYDFPVSIQTKSSLVLRDIDLLGKLREVEVGFTLTTINDETRRTYEPGASSIEERLRALEILGDNGIKTWVFLGPIMPYITDNEDGLEKLIEEVARTGVRDILVDKLRMKRGLWRKIEGFLAAFHPELLPKYHAIFWSKDNYFREIASKAEEICKFHGIKMETLF
jgi:DNA repair photolyase